MKILVTGSNGQLGTTLKEVKDLFEYDVVFADREMLDITNRDQVTKFIAAGDFNYVINAAAYTNVDGAETEKKLAWDVNHGGPMNLAAAVKETSTRLIQISTDYVFRGSGPDGCNPYVEGHTPNPVNYYGETKRAGECPVLRSKNGIVIRTSWLYSFCGKNFVRTIISLSQKKKEISVISDQIGCPTSAYSLGEAIFNMLPQLEENTNWETDVNKINNGERIYHYTNSGLASWYDLACAIKRRLNLECKIIPITTKEYPTPARRPVYSVLSTKKFQETFNCVPTHWEDELYETLCGGVEGLKY